MCSTVEKAVQCSVSTVEKAVQYSLQKVVQCSMQYGREGRSVEFSEGSTVQCAVHRVQCGITT